MTSKQLMLPAHRAFDSDGAPEAGATAHLYNSGTLTPALFYSDPALTISIGSVITANAAGRFDPMPYQDASTAFRIIIEDAEGTVLDDIDPFYFGLVAGVDANPAVASRAALASTASGAGLSRFLSESGREGSFVWNAANVSAQVTNDPGQGVYVAPSSDATGASGAWVRTINGALNVKWFGATGDGVTNDSTAFTRAIAYAASLNDTAGTNASSLFIPRGVYILGSTTFDLTRKITIQGEDVNGTQLKWTGATGFRVQRSNTTGATGVQADSGYITGLDISNLTLDGGYAGGAESEAHAIHCRSGTSGRNLLIQNWPGEGIYLRADTADGAVLGNCNGSDFDNIAIVSCRRGVYANGTDVNACQFSNIRCISNRRRSFHDLSIGNSYVGCLSESNALTIYNTGAANLPCSYVTQGGNQYFVIPGQEVGASTNAPSGTATNNTWWGYWKAGGVTQGVPAWFNGINVQPGGGYRIDGATNQSKLTKCYGENNEVNLIDQCGLVDAPTGMSYTWRFSAGTLGGTFGQASGPNVNYTSANGLEIAGPTKFLNGAWFSSGTNYFGPISGAGSDCVTYFRNTNVFNYQYYQSSGGGQTDAITFSASANAGYRAYGRGGILLGTTTAGNTDILSISDTGCLIASGGLSFGFPGTQIFNATGILQAAGFPALTGAVTTSAGSLATSITNSAVTYAKIQNVTAARLLGNPTGGAAAPSEISLAGGLSFSGTTLTAAGALTPTSIASTGAVTSSSATAGIGYATGAGGTVTQATSRTTGVTLNKLSGAITLVSAAGTATWQTFTVTNTSVAATDTIVVNQKSGTDLYIISVTNVAAGSFKISFATTGGTTVEQPIFQFNVIKGVNA